MSARTNRAVGGEPLRRADLSPPATGARERRYEACLSAGSEWTAGADLNEEEKAGECGLMGVGEITSGANLDGSRKCAAIALAI